MKGVQNTYRILSPLTAFAFLWAGGTLFHATDRFIVDFTGDYVILAVFSLLFLILPSIHTFIYLLIVQITLIVLQFPAIENHFVLVLLVDIVLLIKILQEYLRGKINEEEKIWYRITPLLKALAILTYGCAFFHKLNTGFLDLKNSCAVSFYNLTRLEPWFIPLPEADGTLQVVLIVGVLIIEASIPLLLWWRRSWFPAIVLASLFHIFASQHMRDFPLFAFALFLAFIPESVFTQVAQKIRNLSKSPTVLFSIVSISCVVLAVLGVFTPGGQLLIFRVISFRLWNMVTLVTLGLFAFYVWRNRLHRLPRETSPLLERWHIIILALLVINCALPYLGLRTTSTLSMFSNLRTEAGINNHLLIRDRLLPFSYQDDVVEIMSTNDSVLQRDFVNSGDLIVWHKLKRHVQVRAEQGNTIQLTYRRDNTVYETIDAANSAAFTGKEKWWEHILLDFRPVSPDSSAPCRW